MVGARTRRLEAGHVLGATVDRVVRGAVLTVLSHLKDK